MSFGQLPMINESLEKELPSLRRFPDTLILIETIKNINANSMNWIENADINQSLHQDEEDSFLPPIKTKQRSFSNVTETKKKKVGCTCKKTQCLKMYCECFAKGRNCVPECSCYSCFNIAEYQHVVNKAREGLRVKGTKKGGQGCMCKKSQCQKKYCQCFNMGIPCSEACRCIDCQNHGGDKMMEKQDKITSAFNISKFIHSYD